MTPVYPFILLTNRSKLSFMRATMHPTLHQLLLSLPLLSTLDLTDWERITETDLLRQLAREQITKDLALSRRPLTRRPGTCLYTVKTTSVKSTSSRPLLTNGLKHTVPLSKPQLTNWLKINLSTSQLNFPSKWWTSNTSPSSSNSKLTKWSSNEEAPLLARVF
jgi:hypothetical protein